MADKGLFNVARLDRIRERLAAYRPMTVAVTANQAVEDMRWLVRTVDDLRSRLGCVAEATWWDRGYDTRLEAIRGMCDLTTDGMTPSEDGDQTVADLVAAERDRALAPVLAFVNKRPEYVTALKNTPGEGDQADYWRWQGHAEARRQLAASLGMTVPHNPGDSARPQEVTGRG